MSLYSVKYMDYNVRQKIGPWNTTDMEMTHKEWVTKVNKNIDLTRSTFDKKKKKEDNQHLVDMQEQRTT